MASDRFINVGEFEVPRTLHDILSGLVQSIDEKLCDFVASSPGWNREQLQQRFRYITDIYLQDLMSQLNDHREIEHLLREFFERWLDLCSSELLAGTLERSRHRAEEPGLGSLRIQ